MKSIKPFKRAAALLAGMVISCTASVGSVFAAETTTAGTAAESTETTVSSTEVSEAATEVSTGETTAAEEDEKEIEWYKAELDEYDDSLSLISYETSPEASADGKSKAKDKNKKNGKSKDPTPVELNVTGGYVGDIPWFESEPQIDSVPGKFAVVTYGWGHGVGMSQNGANFYAQYSGWTYQDILFHYYPDTYLMDTGMAEEEEITVAGVSGDVLSMVSQIVYNEVGGSMAYEAIKAQAVAVYTYCKYNGNNSSDLRCKPCPPQNVVDACAEVLGQALYYDGDFALTMFSASSGGVTANCGEVFWADPPYLRSVSSDYDRAYDPHYGTVTYFDDFQLRNMIQSAYGIKLSGDPSRWVQPTYSDSTGYVTYVNIDDQKTVKGYDFKLAIGLKSSKFNVYYTPRPDGEPIPEGSSTPVVVDPDYTHTPSVYYSNGYPTDIGANMVFPTEPVTQDGEGGTEMPTEAATDWSSIGTTAPSEWIAPEAPTSAWTDPTWTDPTWTDPNSGTGTGGYTDQGAASWTGDNSSAVWTPDSGTNNTWNGNTDSFYTGY